MKTVKHTSKLLWDASILLFSNIIVKGLGFAYRVLLVRYLGTECIGLVEMVTPLFSFLIVWSGLGIQTAMTQIIASRPAERFLYLRTARWMLLANGTFVTLLSILAAPLLIQLAAPDPRVLLSFLCITPAILIISYASAYRGYLQGIRNMRPIAASQNTEQLIRSFVGVFLASQPIAFRLETASAAPSIATVCGEAAGLLMLLYCFRKDPEDTVKIKQRYTLSQCWAAGKRMLSYGLPLTGGRLAASGIMMLQAMMIPICLQNAGWDTGSATALYGQFSGVAMSLLHLPGVFTSALSLVIMPAVAESIRPAQNNQAILGRRITISLRATLICTVPGMLLLYLFAEPYCILIFNNAPAAQLLRILAAGGIFFYLQVSLTSILQGLGEVRRLLINSLISGAVLLLGIRFLTTNSHLGIVGAAIATSACWGVGFLLNYLYLRRRRGFSLGLAKAAFDPILAALFTAFIYREFAHFINISFPMTRLSATILQTLIVALLYGALLLLFRKLHVRK